MTAIRVATRKHLELMTPLSTSYEGDKFTPIKGEEYQSVHLLSGNVRDFTFDDLKIGNHILQITLHYPSNKGTYDVEERAAEVVTHFKKGTKLINGDTCVKVLQTPQVANLGTIDDRIIRVVTINLTTGE